MFKWLEYTKNKQNYSDSEAVICHKNIIQKRFVVIRYVNQIAICVKNITNFDLRLLSLVVIMIKHDKQVNKTHG